MQVAGSAELAGLSRYLEDAVSIQRRDDVTSVGQLQASPPPLPHTMITFRLLTVYLSPVVIRYSKLAGTATALMQNVQGSEGLRLLLTS
jgi:hypothetical protein